MEGEIPFADADGRRPVSRPAALVATLAVAIGTVVLVAFNLLGAALTCGDEGSLDSGTASAATRRYCSIAFDEHPDGTAHLSATFTTSAIVALGAVATALTALVTTGRPRWLHFVIAW